MWQTSAARLQPPALNCLSAPKSDTLEIGAVGAGSGTAIASLVSLLPESSLRSALLILAPAMAVLIGLGWRFVVQLLKDVFADIKIARQLAAAKRACDQLNADPLSSDQIKTEAQNRYEALQLLAIAGRGKRVRSVIDGESD